MTSALSPSVTPGFIYRTGHHCHTMAPVAEARDDGPWVLKIGHREPVPSDKTEEVTAQMIAVRLNGARPQAGQVHTLRQEVRQNLVSSEYRVAE